MITNCYLLCTSLDKVNTRKIQYLYLNISTRPTPKITCQFFMTCVNNNKKKKNFIFRRLLCKVLHVQIYRQILFKDAFDNKHDIYNQTQTKLTHIDNDDIEIRMN